jgi:lipid II:glycine glycyltransferase (peptidoglycan interpeptide bridge formation enzyme)
VIGGTQPARVYHAAAAHTLQPVVLEPSPRVWDGFLHQHPLGHLLQSSCWGELKAVFGWDRQCVAVAGISGPSAHSAPTPQADSGLSLLAGAQVLFRSRYGVSIAYVPRGPLFSGDPVVDDLLLATLERCARKRRAVFLRIEPNILADDPQASSYHSWLLLRHLQPISPIQPRSTIHLDLNQPADRVFAALSKGHRADIRRAERRGLVVRVGSAADMPLFYNIMQDTGQRGEFGIHSADYYRLAWEIFQPHSHLLLAEQEGEAVAGHMVFADRQRGYYFYSGATEAGLKAGANHLLQWHALQWAQAQGCTHYDLWGIPDALGRAAVAPDEQQREAMLAEAQHDPLIGVYRFKKGFGGRVVRYLPAYDRVLLPPLYVLWQRLAGRGA